MGAGVFSVMVSLLLFSPVALLRYSMEMYYTLPFLIVGVVWLLREKRSGAHHPFTSIPCNRKSISRACAQTE